jgi:hypothetical protein
MARQVILTARGASSPAKPALHIPEPLSITNYFIQKKKKKDDEEMMKKKKSKMSTR